MIEREKAWWNFDPESAKATSRYWNSVVVSGVTISDDEIVLREFQAYEIEHYLAAMIRRPKLLEHALEVLAGERLQTGLSWDDFMVEEIVRQSLKRICKTPDDCLELIADRSPHVRAVGREMILKLEGL